MLPNDANESLPVGLVIKYIAPVLLTKKSLGLTLSTLIDTSKAEPGAVVPIPTFPPINVAA